MQMSLKQWIPGSLAALSLLLLGCSQEGIKGSTSSEDQDRTYILQTDWYAQPETGGFFHAAIEGFYEQGGSKFEVRPSTPKMINAQMVASGEADFGITRIEDIMMARARGMPLVAISVYFQKSPLALMLHESNPAQSIADLDGETVMLQMGKPFHSWIERHFDIELRAIPHDYGIQRFVTDASKEFIQQAYLTNEPYSVAKADVETKLFPLGDAGYQTFLCLYTTEEMIQTQPEVVQIAVEASARGWRDYLTSDPSKTQARLMELNPVLKPDHVNWSRQQIIDYRLVLGNHSWDDPFNAIDVQRAKIQFELLRDMKIVPADFDWEASFTDAFLSQDS
ncbi:MAG: ABC transporter substrate-binding protein [Verrucomicrobiota bacterium]